MCFYYRKKWTRRQKGYLELTLKQKLDLNLKNLLMSYFFIKYGSENYIPIRSNKDKGNDGTVLIEKKYWIVMLQKNMTKASLRERF